jgi:hypothetical protein
MRIDFSTPTVDRSPSVPVTLQMKYRQHGALCRLEQMATDVAIVSGSRQVVLGILLDATLPAARSGRPAFRAVWVNEAMNRAYNLIRLAALSEKFAPPCRRDVTADEAERRIATEVATVFRSMDVDNDDESMPCSKALMTVVRGLNRLLAPTTGSMCFTADIARLSLPLFKCRALVLAAHELVSGLLLCGLSQSGRGHIKVALCKNGQREMALKVTGRGLGTMQEPPCDSLLDLAELLESNLSFRATCFDRVSTELTFPITNQDGRSVTPIADQIIPGPVVTLPPWRCLNIA